MASVKVAVRVRPFNKRELAMNAKLIVQMDGKRTRISSGKTSGSRDTDKEKYKDFTFDHSYWSYDSDDHNYASQEEVFYDLGTEVIESAFAGYNACVFAYGQTGSGKTFTMMGSPEAQGLIPRICKTLFARMAAGKETGASYRTEVSFLEIHNERVRDLLRQDQTQSHSLKVREHPKNGPYVQNLSNHLVYDYSDIQECMMRGNKHRTTASTNMNDVSSRSHAIFTITFVQAGLAEGNMPSETVSKVHLVDLAGSERANATGATGQRLKEGAHINKSLVTLGSVISALADISSSADSNCSRKSTFIPYRDSVLTWLLKDSLGGNSKTIMIATISPADCNYGETLSTLRYANRAKNIINKPTINEDPNVKLIRDLREQIIQLQSMISKNLSLERPTQEQVLLAQIHEKQEKEKFLTEEWTEKWRETKKILQEQSALGLRKSGVGVVLDSEMPHLVGIDDDLLSTGVTLYHLKEGKTHVGTDEADTIQDIVLNGPDVDKEHCIVELDNGIATLKPLSLHCWINMIQIDKPTRLSQGCIILLGRNNMFRYNDPVEAAKLRKEGGTSANGNLQSTVVNLSRLSLLSWSVSDLRASSSSDNLVNSSEDLRAFEELEQQKAALIKEKEDFKKEQQEREERWTARREALEGAQRELEREWGAQWKEWADAIGALEAKQRELRIRKRTLEQERRDEMTQVENLCKEVASLRNNLQYKQLQFEEFMSNHDALSLMQKGDVNKTDESSMSEASFPESWDSLNDKKSVDAMRELVNHHKKELAALETELKNKVKSLNEHQSRVVKMEKELTEMADKQKEMLNLELDGQEVTETKLQLAKRTQEQLQDILKRKQSLSLNLKRSLPAASSSPGRSSSSSDVLTSCNLKSFQDECNRKLRIASALCLLPQNQSLSTDESDTFHTAAAETPEINELTINPDESMKIQLDTNTVKKYNNNNNENAGIFNDKTEIINDTLCQDNNLKIIENYDDEMDDKQDNDEISTQETLNDIHNNENMIKLNEKIAYQKMMVMKCLESTTPTKNHLNKEISILQDLQRQQIELEILLMKGDKGLDGVTVEEEYNETDTDNHWNLEISEEPIDGMQIREVLDERGGGGGDEEEGSRAVVEATSAREGYSSVFSMNSNRGERLSSPYSTFTRSLPSLFPSDGSPESIIKIMMSVTCYVIRGSGTSSHYEYEVKIVLNDECWYLQRRYRRFREFHVSMKEKYGQKVAAIPFPPRQVFPHYEVVAKNRQKRLEDYLRRLIVECSKLPACEPLYKFRNNLHNLDKKSLLEFSPFFRRGTFESSKYGTS